MRTKTQQGFTLLELVVAVAVLALFSVMAYGALDRVLVHGERISAEREFWRTLSLAFVRMEEDFTHARPRSVRDIDGQPLPPFRGQPTDMRALGEPSVEFTRGGLLIADAGVRADLQRVGYRLRDEVLWRLSWPALDRAPETEPTETPLLRGVESFTVRFLGPGGAADDADHEVWPVEGISDALPRGVEVSIRLTGRGEFTRLFIVNG